MLEKKLKAAAALRGTTLSAVARKTGIPYSTIYRKINGISEFTVKDIVKISGAIGLSDSEIIDIFLR